MAYRLISSKACLARVYDRFNVDYADWETRCPDWIESALADMKVYREYETIEREKEVIDFKAECPCDIKLLEYVSKERQNKEGNRDDKEEGERLNRAFFIPHIREKHNHKGGYTILGNNWVSFPFEKGIVTFHYKRTPIELDTLSGLEYPLIPDVDNLITAICYYIMIMILQRGHVHPVFSLGSPDPYTNPYIMYYGINDKRHGHIVGFKQRARNDINLIDRDVQRQLSTISQNMIVESDTNKNEYRQHHREGMTYDDFNDTPHYTK